MNSNQKIWTFFIDRKGEYCFILAFLLLTFGKALGLNSYDRSYKLLFVVSLLFVGIKILYGKYSWKNFLVMGIGVGLAGVVYLRSGETTFLFTVLLFCGAKDVDLQKLLKLALPVWLFGIILTIFLALVGIKESTVIPYYAAEKLSDYVTETFVVREYSSYGYGHPNYLFGICLISCMLYLFVRYHVLRWYDLLLTGLPMLVVFKLTFCRTGLVLFCLTWLLIAWSKFWKRKEKQAAMLPFFLIVPVVLLCTLVLPRFYDPENPVMAVINGIFTGRIRLIVSWLNAFPITLFGQHCIGAEGFLDSLYPSLLLKGGVVSLLFYVGLFLLIQYQCWKKRDWRSLVMLSVMIVYGVMEEGPANVILNPFLLVLFDRNSCLGGKDGAKAKDSPCS